MAVQMNPTTRPPPLKIFQSRRMLRLPCLLFLPSLPFPPSPIACHTCVGGFVLQDFGAGPPVTGGAPGTPGIMPSPQGEPSRTPTSFSPAFQGTLTYLLFFHFCLLPLHLFLLSLFSFPLLFPFSCPVTWPLIILK